MSSTHRAGPYNAQNEECLELPHDFEDRNRSSYSVHNNQARVAISLRTLPVNPVPVIIQVVTCYYKGKTLSG
jgi:hypothetical protein